MRSQHVYIQTLLLTDLDSGVRRGREHVDAVRGLCEAYYCHDANMPVEGTLVLKSGAVVHLDVLTVGAWEEEEEEEEEEGGRRGDGRGGEGGGGRREAVNNVTSYM